MYRNVSPVINTPNTDRDELNLGSSTERCQFSWWSLEWSAFPLSGKFSSIDDEIKESHCMLWNFTQEFQGQGVTCRVLTSSLTWFLLPINMESFWCLSSLYQINFWHKLESSGPSCCREIWFFFIVVVTFVGTQQIFLLQQFAFCVLCFYSAIWSSLQ